MRLLNNENIEELKMNFHAVLRQATRPSELAIDAMLDEVTANIQYIQGLHAGLMYAFQERFKEVTQEDAAWRKDTKS